LDRFARSRSDPAQRLRVRVVFGGLRQQQSGHERRNGFLGCRPDPPERVERPPPIVLVSLPQHRQQGGNGGLRRGSDGGECVGLGMTAKPIVVVQRRDQGGDGVLGRRAEILQRHGRAHADQIVPIRQAFGYDRDDISIRHPNTAECPDRRTSGQPIRVGIRRRRQRTNGRHRYRPESAERFSRLAPFVCRLLGCQLLEQFVHSAINPILRGNRPLDGRNTQDGVQKATRTLHERFSKKCRPVARRKYGQPLVGSTH